jgi:hypothetical protein
MPPCIGFISFSSSRPGGHPPRPIISVLGCDDIFDFHPPPPRSAGSVSLSSHKHDGSYSPDRGSGSTRPLAPPFLQVGLRVCNLILRVFRFATATHIAQATTRHATTGTTTTLHACHHASESSLSSPHDLGGHPPRPKISVLGCDDIFDFHPAPPLRSADRISLSSHKPDGDYSLGHDTSSTRPLARLSSSMRGYRFVTLFAAYFASRPPRTLHSCRLRRGMPQRAQQHRYTHATMHQLPTNWLCHDTHYRRQTWSSHSRP